MTAVEYSRDTRDASPDIVDRLVRTRASDAQDSILTVSLTRAMRMLCDRFRPDLACARGAFFIGPASLTSGMAALYSPFGETVSANAMFINVSPAPGRVPRGSDQKIKAALTGFDSETGTSIHPSSQDAENWMAP